MPSGSPVSEKYAVYTVTSDESSTDIEEGHIMFRDNISTHAKDSPTQQNLRSFSTDISKWGPYWSSREKCCCFWNILLTAGVLALSVVLLCIHKDILLFDSDGINNNDNLSSNAGSSSIMRPSSDSTDVNRKVCLTQECVRVAAEILSRMNTAVDPCTDIYEYSCGKFSESTSLSWEETRIRDNPDNLQRKYKSFVIDKLSSSIEQSDRSPMKALKMAFQSCKDGQPSKTETQITLQNILITLDKESVDKNSRDYITSLIAHSVRDFGASPLFKVIICKSGKILIFNKFNNVLVKALQRKSYMIGNFRYLTPEDFYFRDSNNDQRMVAYKKFYREAIFSLLHDNNPTYSMVQLLSKIQNALELEIRLNRAWYFDRGTNLSDDVKTCKYRTKLSSLVNSYSGYRINWKLFFSIILQRNVTDDLDLCFVDLSFEITDVLYEADEEAIKAYIKFHLLLNSDLTTIFYKYIPTFNGRQHLTDDSNGQSRCLGLVQLLFPLPSILTYPGMRIFKNKAFSLFETLKYELLRIINDLYWIPVQQRLALMNHTREVTITMDTDLLQKQVKIAYGILHDRTDFSSIMIEALKLKSNFEMKGLQIDTAFDEELAIVDDWNMGITLSSRSMRAPIWYNMASSNVFLYGSLGSFISQALAKVFDIDVLLSHFMNGVIDQEVVFTFAHHFQCLVDMFEGYVITGTQGRTYKARGDLSKAENFRDNLALTMTYNAFKSYMQFPTSTYLPSLNVTDKELFFIIYTQTFCENVNTRGIQKYYIDEDNGAHLPRHIRLKASLSNFDEYSRVFRCPVNSPMNPAKRCNSL